MPEQKTAETKAEFEALLRKLSRRVIATRKRGDKRKADALTRVHSVIGRSATNWLQEQDDKR